MKSKHSILGVVVALLLLNSLSEAQTTYLRIAGSTTYRVSVTAAIINYLSQSGVPTAAYVGSGSATQAGLFDAHEAIFKGVVGGHSYIIKTNWTGSATGVVALATATPLKWLADSTPTAPVVVPGNGGIATQSGSVVTNPTLESTMPDVAMSDAFYFSVAAAVQTARINGPATARAINNAPIQAGGTLGEQNNDYVGLVPFYWITGASPIPSNMTNISQQTAAALIETGAVPLPTVACCAGANPADFVYLIGRNEDSGARIVTFAEAKTGFGFADVQWKLTFSNNQTTDALGNQTGGAGSTVMGLDLFPVNSPMNDLPTINWSLRGHSGYLTGDDLSNTLQATNPASVSSLQLSSFAPPQNTGNAFLIGYLGWSDGYKVIAAANPGTILNYNGSAPTVQNIQYGCYTLWAFEHLYYLSTISGSQRSAADSIADLLFTTYSPTDATGNTATADWPVPGAGVDANEANLIGTDNAAPAGLLFDNSMLFTRSVEGGPLSPR
jgi:hypothetical protein